MNLKNEDGSWSPYLSGALTGLLVIAAAYLSSAVGGEADFLGASTTYARVSGDIISLIAPSYVGANEYYNELKLSIDWEFMIVVGIILGSLISSVTGRSFRIESLAPEWEKVAGKSIAKRSVVAFAGGVVCLFGTRLADGCPSGNGLSGMIQLSVSGYAFFITFFVTAVIVARFAYGRSDNE